MHLPPFLLDKWIEQKHTANPPIEYDLASSTGPVWTLRELLALSGDDATIAVQRLLDTRLLYTTAAGTPDLRSAIAAMQQVDPDEVQVVTGAAEALSILFFLAGEPGANVVLPAPGFPANTALAEGFGVEARYYSIRAENGFRIDIDEIRGLVDRNTRFVLTNSPHNPTGTVFTDDEMTGLHDFCVERGVQFVSDEVYHPIYHGPATKSAARLPYATVIGDFSKALCLSGLRTGWFIDRDPVRRKRYTDARNYFTITNGVLNERLAAIALEHREAIYARAQRVSAANLALLDQLVIDHAKTVCWIRPRGGMTAFPWMADGSDAREFCRALAKRGVLIVPGDCFGQPSHFRLGFAASGDRFPQAIDRIATLLATWIPSTHSLR
jgi:aspartate/methionine/tyrosine aminotransferase